MIPFSSHFFLRWTLYEKYVLPPRSSSLHSTSVFVTPFFFIDGLALFVGSVSLPCLPFCPFISIFSSFECIICEPKRRRPCPFWVLSSRVLLPNRVLFLFSAVSWCGVRSCRFQNSFELSLFHEIRQSSLYILSNVLCESDTGTVTFSPFPRVLKSLSPSIPSSIATYSTCISLANGSTVSKNHACVVVKMSLESGMYIPCIPSGEPCILPVSLSHRIYLFFAFWACVCMQCSQRSLYLSSLGKIPAALPEGFHVKDQSGNSVLHVSCVEQWLGPKLLVHDGFSWYDARLIQHRASHPLFRPVSLQNIGSRNS